MKSRAPQLHLEYRFYKQLVPAGMFKTLISVRPILRIGEYSLVALQHRRIRYIGLRVSADAE